MRKNAAGFTLIELMITIGILGTLTVLTAQAIQQAIRSKVKLQDQIDDVSRMRDSMRLIEADITQGFHYQDLEKEVYDLMKKKTSGQNQGQGQQFQQSNPNQQFQPQSQTDPKYDPFSQNRELPRKDPSTHFIGNSESMNFVTSNNTRTVRNSQQADFAEVGYSLKDCKSLKPNAEGSKCLWRRSSSLVDDDVTKGGDELVLLENVSEFKLRYIGKGKQDWVSDWRSDQGGDAATKNNYPEAVEVSLTVEKKANGKSKKYSMQNVIPIHFPNNPAPPAAGGSNNGSQNPWGTAPSTSQ